MLFSELEQIVNFKESNINSDVEIKQLVTDTRSSDFYSNALFFALKTSKRDGHQYLKDAYNKGIRNFVIEDSKAVNFADDINFLTVDNCLNTLHEIAKAKRSKFIIPVIGITGSNGKTIIKEWLSQILAKKFVIVKSPKSYNSQIGVPLSVWQIEKRHNLGIFEAGISQKGEMLKLNAIIRPNIGILSNIGSAHDGGFSDRNEKLKEKLLLFKNCEKLILREDEYALVKSLKNELGIKELISWGKSEENKYPVSFNKNTLNTTVLINGFAYAIPFSDTASLENILHVIICSLEMGMEPKEIQEGISLLSNVSMRLEVKEAENDCILIDDTYNHDEGGLKVALEYLASQYKNFNKSLIISDLKQTSLSDEAQIEFIKSSLSKIKLNHKILIGDLFSNNSKSFSQDFLIYKSVGDFLKNIPNFNKEVLLIKGARQMQFERIVKQLEKQLHGTRLEINLSNITHNLDYFRTQLKANTKMMVMVKAFAYGAGSREIANLLQFSQVDYLGVAYANEGVDLRKQGLNLPIFVMNPASESLALCFEYNLEPEIFSFKSLEVYSKEAALHDKKTPVHINIDTGMNRLGFDLTDISRLSKIINSEKIQVASIFSHLSSSDDLKEKEFTLSQIQKFNKAYDEFCKETSSRPIKHILNSAGIVNFPEHQYDMVRLGVGLYGVNNAKLASNPLLPIGRLISEISQIKTIAPNESIGYSRKGNLPNGGKIATIPMGYADGFSRIFSNGKGRVYVNGKLAPVIGNVCMDMFMIDISNVEAEEGDEVVIFGEKPTVTDLAEWSDTIPYEILTNISERVKRVYIND
ncbi:bifunctional UDP-N-acetylmuramoyl-tripeptide:D-alanyl-D-alanine ligase/alanine racemase [Hyphobacterium sp. CCMP332]|nr:bifunctional UDP-N-acetylmuramoyl-tripeptide:D-alanyl-D-alanine ligase/alanine racemase [Hyphobacterium sp. CCMP332]